MSKIITGHFDGKVIVLDKKVKLPVGKRLRIQVEVVAPANGKTPPSNGKKKTKPIEIIGTGMFDSGIPDLATNKKHLEGLGKSSMGRKYRKITGAGQFNSGVPDLATNKKYMEGFGES